MRKEQLSSALDLLDDDVVEEVVAKDMEYAEKKHSGKRKVLYRFLAIAAAVLLIGGVTAAVVLRTANVLPQTTDDFTSNATTSSPTETDATTTIDPGTTAEPPQYVTQSNMTFSLSADRASYSVVSFSSVGASFVVPETVCDLPVTEISDGAIDREQDDMTSVITLRLSKNIKTIAEGTFLTPSDQIRIIVDDDNTVFYMANGCLVRRGDKTLLKASKDYERIPDGVKTIAPYAFYQMRSLKTVEIPSGVKSIGREAFLACSSLAEISLPKSVSSIGENAFSMCRALSRVNVPSVAAFRKIDFANRAADPTSLGAALYENGKKYEATTVEPDRAQDPEAWLKWLTEDPDAVMVYPMLSYGKAMENVYYDDDGEKYPPSGWELYGDRFRLCYTLDQSAEEVAGNVGDYTWEIFYRVKNSREKYRSIVTAAYGTYRFNDTDGMTVYFLPTYEKGMTDLSSNGGKGQDYDFVFVIREGAEPGGEIKWWYKDVLTVTSSYDRCLADALNKNVFDPDRKHVHDAIWDSGSAPTCTEYGHTFSARCRSCGEWVKNFEVIRPLGHQFKDGVCMRCGYRSISFEELNEADAQPFVFDHAEELKGIKPDSVLHPGATEASPIVYDPSFVYDYKHYLAFGFIADKTEFDVASLALKGVTSNHLRLWYMFREAGTDQEYCEPCSCGVSMTDIDDRYALCRFLILTEYYGYGLCSDDGKPRVYEFVLMITEPAHDMDEGDDHKEVRYTKHLTVSLTDSFDMYYLDMVRDVWRYLRVQPAFHTHSLEIVGEVAPTCTMPGVRGALVCRTCGTVVRLRESIPALGHAMIYPFIGDRQNSICVRCGHIHDDAVIPAIAPTCTTGGYSEGRWCSVCGEVLITSGHIPPLGHNVENGACTRCGVNVDKDVDRLINKLMSGGKASLRGGEFDFLSDDHQDGVATYLDESSSDVYFRFYVYEEGRIPKIWREAQYYNWYKMRYELWYREKDSGDPFMLMPTVRISPNPTDELFVLDLQCTDETPLSFHKDKAYDLFLLIRDSRNGELVMWNVADLTVNDALFTIVKQRKVLARDPSVGPDSPAARSVAEPKFGTKEWLDWLVNIDGIKYSEAKYENCLGGGSMLILHTGAEEPSPFIITTLEDSSHFVLYYRLEHAIGKYVEHDWSDHIYEIWYRDADKGGEYKRIVTRPIYYSMLAVYDDGMNDLMIPDGDIKNEYEIIVIVYRNEISAKTLLAWKMDRIAYTDSSEMYLADAREMGIVS